MVGRSAGCLLVAAFILLDSSVVVGQADPRVLSPQRFVAERYSWQLPAGRTIHPVRPPIVISTPLGFGFPQFVRAAGMIFSGTVTNVERRPGTLGQSVETVAVTFHVENAIRGAIPGESLTITQWMGLWSSGQRYRVGERVLLFLYPNSKLGLTSWVGGTLGRFEMDPAGRVLLNAHHLVAFRKDPVLGGKSRARFRDFARAVKQAGEEE